MRGSNEEDYFKHHINSSFRKIYDVNLRKNSVASLTSGIEQMKAKYVRFSLIFLILLLYKHIILAKITVKFQNN